MRAVTAILLAPFAILALEWGLRLQPSERMPCAEAGPPGVRAAWVAGVAPAAFLAGCVCLAVILRISAQRRGGRPGAATLVAIAVWLALAVSWWSGGRSSPMTLLAALAYALLIPSLIVVATLVVLIVARPSWTTVTGLAWLCAIVLVPGFVAVVETWNADFYC